MAVYPTTPAPGSEDASNPGFATPGMNPPAPHTFSKPPAQLPSTSGFSKPPAPLNQSPDMHRRAQERMPFTPNNGNPRGAHNTSPWRGQVPGLRTTRHGGGFIGAEPPQGAVLGSNGAYFGQGAITPQQQARNQNLMAQMRQTLMQNPSGMPFRTGLPQSQPQPGMPTPPGLSNGMGPPSPVSQVNGYPTPQGPMYRGGQDPSLGRYRPPSMGHDGNWQDWGGYSYNLPNPFGPYPNFGQGPYGYGPGGG